MVANRRWQRTPDRPAPLFDGVPARPGSPTSVAAAKSIAHAIEYIEARTVSWLEEQGPFGGTADECEVALDLIQSTGSARFSELKSAGRIIRTPRKRKTRRNRSAAVHVHPKFGDAGCSPSAA